MELYRGAAHDMEVQLAGTGIGPRKSKKAAASILDKLKPDCILNLGSAGSLHDSLEPGTIFIPQMFSLGDGDSIKQMMR